MPLPSNDRLMEVMHELGELRAELAHIHKQQSRHTKNRWRLPTGLLAISFVILASGAWSAQTVDPALLDIQKRLSALESLIRKGPGDMTQVTGPLDVIGPDGKHILVVRNAGLEIMNPAGNRVAYIGADTDGKGKVTVGDAKGTDRAVMAGDGSVSVLDAHKSTRVMLSTEETGGGWVTVYDPKGSERAQMSGFGTIRVFNMNEQQVAAITAGENDLGHVAIYENRKKVVGMAGLGNGSGYVYLKDQQGKVPRTMLASGAIALFDKEGNETLELSADLEGDGGMLRLGDKKNMYRAMMGVNSAGGFVSVSDTKDALRAAMTGEGKVVVYDKDRIEVADMSVTPEGRGRVGIRDKDKLRMHMGVDDESNGFLMGYGVENNPRALVSGRGEIVVYDKDITEVAGMRERPEFGGGLVSVSDKGNVRAAMAIDATNKIGFLSALNEKNVVRVMVSGDGIVAVANEKRVQVAGISSSDDGNGRVSVWSNDEKSEVLARMSADEGGSGGRLNIMNPAGKVVAQMRGGEKAGGGVRVANSAGVPVAEMALTDDGRGRFQVNKDTRPVAVLTQAVDRPGGIVQISNFSGQTIASLTGGESGGYFQLTNKSGVGIVEAGILPDGRGTVRTGPAFRCQSARTPLFSGGSGDCIVGSNPGGAS